MADLANTEKNHVTIEGPTGTDLLVNAEGTLPVNTEGKKATYSAAFSNITIAAAATDMFTILGSATKTIRVTHIAFFLTTTAGSGTAVNLTLIKRSTADTAGTSTTATVVPHDSNSAAGTAVVRSYTANPTLGTTVGNLRSSRLNIPTIGSSSNEILLDFGTRDGQAIVLRGTSEQLALNLGGATVTGPVASFSVEWTEE